MLDIPTGGGTPPAPATPVGEATPGTPNPGTPKDKRLKANQAAKAGAKGGKKAPPFTKKTK